MSVPLGELVGDGPRGRHHPVGDLAVRLAPAAEDPVDRPEHGDGAGPESAVAPDRRGDPAEVDLVLTEVDAVALGLRPADLLEQGLAVGRRTTRVALERRLPQLRPEPGG